MSRHNSARHTWKVLLTITALTVGSFLTTAVNQPATASLWERSSSDADPTATAEALGKAFNKVSEEVLPSVVTVTSERVLRVTNPLEEFFFGPFGRGRQREYRQSGLGSGVIVDPDGIILTCNHVVEDAENIQVRLLDDRIFDAEVVGTDPGTDIAVLRVEPDEPLPAARLGDSDAIEVGEWVLALGNPFGVGLRGTVTAGIVSAKGRSGLGLVDYESSIQTDAAINPGNSGGPLVNLRGEVIGINSAIASRTGGYQGLGFAIPINMAKQVMQSILEHGRVVRGWLGVKIQNLTDVLRKELGVDEPGGALITEVVEGSPAEEAGLKEEDVVIEVDGKHVQDVADLRFRIAGTPPGTTVELTVVRDGKRKRIEVTLGELEDGGRASSLPVPSVLEDLGFEVEDLDEDLRAELDVPDDIEGVVVTYVARRSVAFREGLRTGDVITHANRHRIRSVDDLYGIIEDLEAGDTLMLKVWGRGGKRLVAMKIRG